ncbi:cobalamin biosynthesis protein [Acidilobus sp.]|jgi:adenosylcobinamide-phosphate synthase|uniref:cobalamin biosynthesis protein n=1 Tax=Acidilobus sp. TaxID=1872109 RepID=UPI003D07DCAD
MLPSFLYPGPLELLSALTLALVLDIVYPYHSGFMLMVHPVHTSYFMALRLYRPFSSRARGAMIWAAVMSSHLAAYAAALYLAYRLSPIAWVIVAGYITKTSASLRLLIDEVSGAGRALEEGDLSRARALAQGLVRRDLSVEDAGHVASAAIESLAESLNDGFVSPLLWYAVLGPLGALAQRLVNTLDGALGFKDPEHLKVGWTSAWADTIVNYIPARLTAALIVIASARFARRAAAAWASCSGLTESLNAGAPMSAMAGSLGVTLEKRGSYTLCPEFGRLPGSQDIRRSVRVATAAATLMVSLEAIILALLRA